MGISNCLLEERKLVQTTYEDGRVYTDHRGREYISVTTFLSSFSRLFYIL